MTDYTVGGTINKRFTTRAFGTGVPTVLAGTPVISAYEDNSTTQITAGITLGVDHDSVVGLNLMTIVATGGNGFETGKDYDLVITTGTVGGVSVVGEVVGSFTLGRSAAAARLPVALVGGRIDANVGAISGSATAADNEEAQFDGVTGLVGDLYPSSQAQVGNISSGSSGAGAVNATGVTVTTGTETLTYTATHAQDGVVHEVAAAGGNTDFHYTVTLLGNQSISDVTWRGYIQSNGDSVQVQFYDWVAAGWVTEKVLDGSNGTTLIDETFDAVSSYTGTGANLGEVRLRFLSTTSTNVATDRLRFVFSSNFQSVGYDGGKVWLDTTHGIAGTVPWVNGVADNKSLTLADAIVIAASVPLESFEISPESVITFAEAHTDEVWRGDGWTLALGGRDVSQTHIYHCNDISGIGTSPSGEVHILDSHIGAITLGECHITNCSFDSTFAAGAAGDYFIEDSRSGVAGSGSPTLTFTGLGSASNVNARGWMGGGTWSFDSDITASIEVLVGGTHTITTGGGDIEFRGAPKNLSIVTSGTGTTNIVIWSGAPIAISGTGGTVNIYGLHNGITDTSSGTTVNDFGANIVDIPAILADTANMQPKLGTPAVDVSADIAALKVVADAVPTTAMRGTDGANTTAPDNAGVAAIKTKTDKLTFTSGNDLDANIQKVNDQVVSGDGGSGTEWGGA